MQEFSLVENFWRSLVLLPFKMNPNFKIPRFFIRQNFCSPGSSSSEFARDNECQYVNKTFAVSNSLGTDRILKDWRIYQCSGLVSRQLTEEMMFPWGTISNQCTWFSTTAVSVIHLCCVRIIKSVEDSNCFLWELRCCYWYAILFCHFRGGRGGGGTRHNCSSYVLSVCARCLDRPAVWKAEGCSK